MLHSVSSLSVTRYGINAATILDRRMWSKALNKTTGRDPGYKWTWHARNARGEAVCRVGMRLADEIMDAEPTEDGENRICLACKVRLDRAQCFR